MDSRQDGRKTIRRSLKTKELTEAIAKIGVFLGRRWREMAWLFGNISWYGAVDIYIARQKMAAI